MNDNNDTSIETHLAQACHYLDEVTGGRDTTVTPVYTASIDSMRKT